MPTTPYTNRGENWNGFKDTPSGRVKGEGQCFECGLWFENTKGYVICKEHSKKISAHK